MALLAAFTSVALVGRSTPSRVTLRPALHGAATAGAAGLWPLVAVLVTGTMIAVVATLVLLRYRRRRLTHQVQVKAVLSEVDRALADPLLVLQARRRLHQARPSGDR